MANLYFRYSTMNAGKSAHLIQAAFNYLEQNMRPLIGKSSTDTRILNKPAGVTGVYEAIGQIESRGGGNIACGLFSPTQDLYQWVLDHGGNFLPGVSMVNCVLIDEAQFLTPEQVDQLCKVVDVLNIPVLCYGLRTDFQGKLFPGSAALLANAEKLSEIKTLCNCGSKATHVVRVDKDGQVLQDGAQVVIGNDNYISVCRRHFNAALAGTYKPCPLKKITLD